MSDDTLAMTFDDVIEHFGRGSPTEAAKVLGMSRQSLYRWKTGIDEKTQAWLEILSGGALRSDLRAIDITPKPHRRVAA